MEQHNTACASPVTPAEEIAVRLANKFINILDVSVTYTDNNPTGYLILFEYRFKTPTRDGWHKFAIECQTSSLNVAYMQVYNLATTLQERMKV